MDKRNHPKFPYKPPNVLFLKWPKKKSSPAFANLWVLLVFSMLNENFFVTCKVKMDTNVVTKIIEHVEPKVFKLGFR